MLVHCISGWDRTPLFISLLRILLWAGKWKKTQRRGGEKKDPVRVRVRVRGREQAKNEEERRVIRGEYSPLLLFKSLPHVSHLLQRDTFMKRWILKNFFT
jgi:hypothetical protein